MRFPLLGPTASPVEFREAKRLDPRLGTPVHQRKLAGLQVDAAGADADLLDLHARQVGEGQHQVQGRRANHPPGRKHADPGQCPGSRGRLPGPQRIGLGGDQRDHARAIRTELPPGEDAARPLGNRTMPLKFGVPRLEPLAGSRIVVDGLLIGEDGVDGINVTTVSRGAPACP